MANEVEIYQQRKRERQEQSALVDAPVVAPQNATAQDYIVRKQAAREQNAAAAALVVENSGDPDQNAADDLLAREFQTKVNPDVTPPPSFVATNRDLMAAQVKRTDTTKTLSSSPMLTRWLDNTANARVAADDVSVLATIEAGFGHLRDALKRGIVDRSQQVGAQIASDLNVWAAGQRGLSFEDRFKDARGEHYGYGFFGKPMEPGQGMKPDGTVDLPKIQEMGDEPVTAFFKAATGTVFDFVFPNTREGSLEKAATFQQFAAQAAANAASTPMSETAQRALAVFQSDEPLSLGEATQRALDLAVNDPGALAAMIAEVGIESTGAMIPAAIAVGVTRNPAVGAAVMGGTSYGVERGTTPVEFFTSKGYDLTKPEDVKRMLANPELMAEAAQKGHTRGLIIGALDMVSGGLAGRVLARNPIADAALQSMVQGALGGSGEGFAQYATEGEVNFGDVLVEALAEFSTAPIEVTAIGARKFGEQQEAAKRTETAAPVLDELSQAAQTSKLRERSPAAFADYIANATRGGEMETMYIPAEAFVSFFQSQGVSLETVAEILPGVELAQLQRAVVTGEDIAMPTSTYMERVAGSDMDAFVLENSKFAPQDMTRAEAAAFREDEAVQQARVAGEQVAARITREAEASATEMLQTDIAEQLVAAGRPRQAAQQEAQLYPAFYNALASRMGITVEELMKTYRPPTVRGAEVSPLQAKQVDAITRDLAGMRGRIAMRAAGGVQQKGADADTPSNAYLDQVEQSVIDAGLDPATATDDEVRAALDPDGKSYSQAAKPEDRVEAFRKYMSARTFATQEEAVAQLRRVIDKWNAPDPIFGTPTAMSYDIIDSLIVKNGKKFGVSQKGLKPKPKFEASSNPIGQAPEAAWNAQDMQDYRKEAKANETVSNLYVSFDSIPKAKLAGGKNAYDWSELERGGAIPPVTLRRNKNGSVTILDGNHRIEFFREQGFDSIPAYVLQPKELAAKEFYQSAAAPVTDSAEFKAWFGDSKVVDENGDPLVVYHGTNQEFDAFDVVRGGAATGENAGATKAFFFTDSTEVADQYAKNAGEKVVAGVAAFEKERARLQKEVTRLEKAAQRTGDWDAYETAMSAWEELETNALQADDATGVRNVEVYLAITNPMEIDFEGGRLSAGQDVEQLIEDAKAAGHDGLILRNLEDSPKMGVVATHYAAFEPTQIKSATDNSGAFSADSANIYQQEERGRISIPANGVASGAAVIDLFQKADLSTFLHESGHFFLSVLQDAGAQPNAPQQVRDMYAQATSWWRDNADAVAADAGNGVAAADVATYLDNGTTGDAAKDAAIDTGMQEQWARAFETYLLEGKAPTDALRGAFEQFRAWLMEVYRKVKGDLNVRVTDDIRQVFDRLLATDAEIAKANVDNNGAMLAKTAAELGVSEADYQKLAALHQEAQDQAAARTIAEAMEPIRRMREAEYKARHAVIRTEVENEVNARPVYRAIEWMGNKRWLGGEATELPNGMRLNKEQLVDRYGPGVLRTLPRGSFRVYTPDGMDIDEAAGWFGFSSGDELVKAMEQAPRREDVIANETDSRAMAELNRDAGLADAAAAATEAFHSDKRGDYIAAELRTLNIGLGGAAAKTSTASYARQVAKRTLGGMKARDAVASNRYLAAERKAAEQAQAAFAGGDRAKAADYKRQQLFNHMMFTESRRIADEVGKTERLAKRLASKGTRKNLATDYLGAIDDVLEQYDFRKQGPGKEARRERMLAYVEKMKAAGRENEIAIPLHILENARAEPYMTLTVDRLRGVHDTLKNIESTARRAQKLIDAKSERDMDQIVADFGDAFAQNVKPKPPARVENGGERARRGFRQFVDLVLNADTLLREIDGFSDVEGPAYINLKRGIDEATSRLQVRRQQAAADFEKLYGVYTVKERNQMAVATFVPELKTSMAKWDMISMVLNMGNADNIQRMTDPKVKGSFTKAQLDAVLGRMDKRDMDFVQSVWDYVDSFYAEIAARELRTTGVAPQKVEAQTLTTPHGDYKGGYYPLKYDPRLSDRVAEESADEVMNNMRAGRFGKAQTRNGHTKERAQSSGRAVMLDIGVLHSHINTVLHDLEMSEQVTNTWRILQEPRIKGMFLDSGKQVDHQALEMWVQDAASGQVNSADVLSKTARFLKSGFTVSKLAFNLSTVAVQITGVAQSMVVIGKKDFTKGAAMYLRNPLGTSQDVVAKSAFMAERETTFNKDIYDIMGDVKVGPKAGLYKRAMQNYIGPASFYLMQKVQFYAVDMPTWLGAYQKGLRTTGNDEAASVQYADRMVARAQASGIFSDRSPIERGTLTPTIRQNDFVRMFTALGSYMFAKANVAYERTGKTDFRSPKEVLSYTVDMVLLFTVEAVLYNAIKGTLPGMGGGDDDDDKGGPLEWAKFLATETALSVMSTMPFVRDLSSPLQGFSGGGSYGSISETLTKPFLQAAQGEVDKAFVKSMVDSTGMLLHLPASQVNRFIDAGWRASEGEDVAPIEYIMGKR